MTNFYVQHNKAYVAVDCIIFGFDEGKLKLLIGKRKMDPGFDEWSLYGGFVEQNESIDEAASRVLYNLTGMKNAFMKQVANSDKATGQLQRAGRQKQGWNPLLPDAEDRFS